MASTLRRLSLTIHKRRRLAEGKTKGIKKRIKGSPPIPAAATAAAVKGGNLGIAGQSGGGGDGGGVAAWLLARGTGEAIQVHQREEDGGRRVYFCVPCLPVCMSAYLPLRPCLSDCL